MLFIRRVALRRIRILPTDFEPRSKSTASGAATPRWQLQRQRRPSRTGGMAATKSKPWPQCIFPQIVKGRATGTIEFSRKAEVRLLFFLLQYLHTVGSSNKRFRCNLQEQAVFDQADYVIEMMCGFFGIVHCAEGTV